MKNKGGRPRIYEDDKARKRAYYYRRKLKEGNIPKVNSKLKQLLVLSQPKAKTQELQTFVKSKELQKAQNNLTWKNFCKMRKIEPYYYQENWFTLLWKTLRTMLLAPRGHGKTWLVIQIVIYYLIKTWPTGTALFVTSRGRSARRAFKQVYQAFTRDVNIMTFLGYDILIENKNASTREIWFPRVDPNILDASFSAVGRGEEIIGGHQELIALEDILQKMSKAEETEENLQEWFDATVKYIMTVNTRIITSGTRKGKGDLYEHMMPKGRFTVHVFEAIKLVKGRWPEYEDFEWKDNNPIGLKEDFLANNTFSFLQEQLPINQQTHTLESLLIDRYLDYVTFEREMCNNVIPIEGLYFDPNDMMHYESIPVPSIAHIMTMDLDPSFGRKSASDFTSITVLLFVPSMNRIYVVEHYLKQSMTYDEIIDVYTEIYFKWKRLGYVIRSATVEDTMYQNWIMDGLKKAAFPFAPRDERMKVSNKIERIASLAPPFKMHYFYFNKQNAGYSEVEYQISNFDMSPSTATRKDDFLDTLEAAYSTLQVSTYKRVKLGFM